MAVNRKRALALGEAVARACALAVPLLQAETILVAPQHLARIASTGPGSNDYSLAATLGFKRLQAPSAPFPETYCAV
jgi:hypothetical protein